MRRAISFRSRTASSPDTRAGQAFLGVVATVLPVRSPPPTIPVAEMLVAEVSLCKASASSLVAVTTALVTGPAGGTRLATSFVMNSSIRSSPSFLRNVLVMLMTTASIGIIASKLP